MKLVRTAAALALASAATVAISLGGFSTPAQADTSWPTVVVNSDTSWPS